VREKILFCNAAKTRELLAGNIGRVFTKRSGETEFFWRGSCFRFRNGRVSTAQHVVRDDDNVIVLINKKMFNAAVHCKSSKEIDSCILEIATLQKDPVDPLSFPLANDPLFPGQDIRFVMPCEDFLVAATAQGQTSFLFEDSTGELVGDFQDVALSWVPAIEKSSVLAVGVRGIGIANSQTFGGCSGATIFDASWRFVGIHLGSLSDHHSDPPTLVMTPQAGREMVAKEDAKKEAKVEEEEEAMGRRPSTSSLSYHNEDIAHKVSLSYFATLSHLFLEAKFAKAFDLEKTKQQTQKKTISANFVADGGKIGKLVFGGKRKRETSLKAAQIETPP
jgi:hypothetical protein